MTTADMITSTEAARRAGIAPATLRKAVRRGDLQAYRDPLNARVKLLRVADLDALRAPRPMENRSGSEARVA